MPVLAPTGTFKVEFNFTLANGAAAAVVQHGRVFLPSADPAPCNALDMQSLADNLRAWAHAGDPGAHHGWVELASKWTRLDSVVVSSMDSLVLSQGIALSGAIGTGSVSTPLPPETAIVATWDTILIGRRHRGRSYWPGGLHEAVGNDGLFDPGVLALWQQTMDDLWQNAYTHVLPTTGNAAIMVVYSRANNDIAAVEVAIVRNKFHHISGRNA